MQTNSILLENISPEQLIIIINNGIKSQLEDFIKSLPKDDPNELLTRTQACEFLKIDSSTLWHWTNKGKIKCHAIANRRYYKKAELLASLIELKTKNKTL